MGEPDTFQRPLCPCVDDFPPAHDGESYAQRAQRRDAALATWYDQQRARPEGLNIVSREVYAQIAGAGVMPIVVLASRGIEVHTADGNTYVAGLTANPGDQSDSLTAASLRTGLDLHIPQPVHDGYKSADPSLMVPYIVLKADGIIDTDKSRLYALSPTVATELRTKLAEHTPPTSPS